MSKFVQTQLTVFFYLTTLSCTCAQDWSSAVEHGLNRRFDQMFSDVTILLAKNQVEGAVENELKEFVKTLKKTGLLLNE